MSRFLAIFCALFALICGTDATVNFDLVRTPGGHLGAHFILGTNNSMQYRFLLYDLTSTGLWTFVSPTPVEDASNLPGPFDVSADNFTQFVNTSSLNMVYDLSYKFFNAYGYYDAPMSTNWIPFQVNSIISGNTTLRNQTTTILGIPSTALQNYPFWNLNLFDGAFGIGNKLENLVPNTNFTTGWIKNTSTILLYTPPDVATHGKLVIDATAAPAECENAGLAVNLSKMVYLRSSDFEFNITAVAGNYDGSIYAYEKTWPATISTMSSFISVDNTTWNWISQQLNPVTDAYASPGSDISHPYFKVHCAEAANFRLAITMTDQMSGNPVPLLIPGTSLIQTNPYGECLLKVQPNSADFWVLGTPFLENYCFQVNPTANEIIFMNTTVSMAYPVAPTANYGQSQLFFNMFGYKSK